MAKDLKTYYDFADNNFNFLIAAYEQGLVGNAMGAMAQETCEKYLKHIIKINNKIYNPSMPSRNNKFFNTSIIGLKSSPSNGESIKL